MRQTSSLVALYAVLLLVGGVALVFAGEEIGASVEPRAGAVFPQLLGAALFGFGAMNWTARGLMLGGIYGRAVVAGNQAFAFVGVLSLLGKVGDGVGAGFWLLLAVFGYGAVLFTRLMFWGPPEAKDS